MNWSRRQVIWLAAACMLAAGIYLLASVLYFRSGYPLDDSWIHQTYARNLAATGQLAFLPGQPSAGSTAPLWTALLALGYLIGVSPYWWTMLLGTACLLVLAWLAEQVARSLSPDYKASLPLMGLLVVFDWRHTWAAVSGMEILLYTLLVGWLFLLIVRGSQRYFLMGVIVGLSVWVRPDGLTLLGPLGFTVLFFYGLTPGDRVSALLRAGLGLASLLVPYLLFNMLLSGSPFPNTFYAKQAEYAFWQAKPAWEILATLAVHLVTGISMALVAGAVLFFVRAFRERNAALLACLLWAIGYLLLYAFRLPMYQHGRYLMPALSMLLVLGGAFFLQWVYTVKPRLYTLRFAWVALTAMLGVVFFVFGAFTYAQDVAFIESEMVQTSQWVTENIPPGAVIAVHDIGAIGYANRDYRLVDLAGLITPDVIPFIRDETRLAVYLDSQQVEYLVVFPNWYPELAARSELIYRTGSIYAPMQGGENMAIYRWQKP